MNYISIDSVFTHLPQKLKNDIENNVIREWIIKGLGLLQIKQTYNRKVCTLIVNDHKTDTPRGLKFVESIAYMYNNDNTDLVASYITNISKDTTVEMNGDSDVITETITKQTIVPPRDYPNLSHILRIQHMGVINNYKLWYESDIFHSNFVIMRLTNKAFSGEYHCSYCPNLKSSCQYYYTFHPNGTITTNIQNGVLCISYLELANENGQYLIPDNEVIKHALSAYVKMRYWEEKYFMEPNLIQLYKNAQQESQLLFAKAKGESLLRELDIDDLHAQNRLLVNWATSDRVFNNLKY